MIGLPKQEILIIPEDIKRAGTLCTDLKPCPFCGKNPLSSGKINEKRGNYVAQIFCSNCLISMVCCEKLENLEIAREKVKTKWNKRT